MGLIVHTMEYPEGEEGNEEDDEGLVGNQEGLRLETMKKNMKARLAVKVGR